MKFCTKCGKEINENATVCMHCGCKIYTPVSNYYETDSPSNWLWVLGFFFPLIGLIFYLSNKYSLPLKAYSAGKGALIGFLTGTAFTIILLAILLDSLNI